MDIKFNTTCSIYYIGGEAVDRVIVRVEDDYLYFRPNNLLSVPNCSYLGIRRIAINYVHDIIYY